LQLTSKISLELERFTFSQLTKIYSNTFAAVFVSFNENWCTCK